MEAVACIQGRNCEGTTGALDGNPDEEPARFGSGLGATHKWENCIVRKVLRRLKDSL